MKPSELLSRELTRLCDEHRERVKPVLPGEPVPPEVYVRLVFEAICNCADSQAGVKEELDRLDAEKEATTPVDGDCNCDQALQLKDNLEQAHKTLREVREILIEMTDKEQVPQASQMTTLGLALAARNESQRSDAAFSNILHLLGDALPHDTGTAEAFAALAAGRIRTLEKEVDAAHNSHDTGELHEMLWTQKNRISSGQQAIDAAVKEIREKRATLKSSLARSKELERVLAPLLNYFACEGVPQIIVDQFRDAWNSMIWEWNKPFSVVNILKKIRVADLTIHGVEEIEKEEGKSEVEVTRIGKYEWRWEVLKFFPSAEPKKVMLEISDAVLVPLLQAARMAAQSHHLAWVEQGAPLKMKEPEERPKERFGVIREMECIHPLMPDFIRAMNRIVEHPADTGGLLSDLHDIPFMFRRLTADLGVLGDYIDHLHGFDEKDESGNVIIAELCEKIATWALCIMIRRRGDEH